MFLFYSDSEALVHGHEIFKIYGILQFAVGYFLLDSVLMTYSSIPDSCFDNWSNFTNNHKGVPRPSLRNVQVSRSKDSIHFVTKN
jgi:site-specific recombinase